MNDRTAFQYIGRRDEDAMLIVFAMPSDAARDPSERDKLASRNDLVDHSPSGFECGYCGSGPAQLSLAILAHHLAHYSGATPAILAELARAKQADVNDNGPLDIPLPDRLAIRYHQAFKVKTIAALKRDGFVLTSTDVVTALDSIRFSCLERLGAAEANHG